MIEFAAQHPLPIILGLVMLCLGAINYSWLVGLVRPAKPRLVPARNILSLSDEMLSEACKLEAGARDATNKLVDEIKRISEQSIIETPAE